MDASTSTSTGRASLKRKAATLAEEKLQPRDDSEEDESSSETEDGTGDEAHDDEPMVDAAAADDDDKAEKEDEQEADVGGPKKKKAKKELKKKVAVWRDLKGWKEGDDPLGRFPVEVLDLIINIDADLDLRDHLALAATCRYFRTCYRDVVFQVLFESKHRYVDVPAEYIKVSDAGGPYSVYGRSNSRYTYYRISPSSVSFTGPVHRSWNEARWIFSSSKLARDGWGVANDQWVGSADQQAGIVDSIVLSGMLDIEREKQRLGIERDVNNKDEQAIKDWEIKLKKFKVDRESLHLANRAAGQMLVWNPRSGPWAPNRPNPEGKSGVKTRMDALMETDVSIYGESVRPKTSVVPKLSKWEKKQLFFDPDVTVRDPWNSPWRHLVAEIVNRPRITKTDAKAIFKVSDRELLSLPKVHKNHYTTSGTAKHFMKAAVEALSLRSHGGANGHKAYLDKLQVRSDKAHKTRVKNGTLPKGRMYMYDGLYYEEYY